MVTFRQAVLLASLAPTMLVTLFSVQFIVSTGTSRSSMRCLLHITISISYTCQSHSIICHVFLQCQVSCPGAGVSVLLCITVHTFSFCFLDNLAGVLATTAAFCVLALSPSLFLIFLLLLKTHILNSHSSFYIYLSISAFMSCSFPLPCLITLAQDVSH